MKQVDAPNCICFPLSDDVSFPLSDNETEYNLKCFDRITRLDYIKDQDNPFWAVYYYDPEIERARLGIVGGTSPYSYIVYKGVKYENAEDVFKLQAVLENEETERAINAL